MKNEKIKKTVRQKDGYVRVIVNKSNKNMFVQVVDDKKGETLVGVSTLKMEKSSSVVGAEALGVELAKRCKEKKIEKVVFDRNGLVYKGRVKSLVESARKEGMKF